MVRVNSLWRQVLQEGQSGKVSTLDLKGAVDQNLSAMAFRGPVNFYGNLFTTNPTLREVNAVRAKAGWWTDKEINFQCTLFLATDKVVYLYVWNEPPIENIMPVERGSVLVPHGPRCYHNSVPKVYPASVGGGNTWTWSIQNPPNPGEDGWWYVVGQPGDAPFMKWTTPCLNAKLSSVPQAINNIDTGAVSNYGGDHVITDFARINAWELEDAYQDQFGEIWLLNAFNGLVGTGFTCVNNGPYPISFRALVVIPASGDYPMAWGQTVELQPGAIGQSFTGLTSWEQSAGMLVPFPGIEVWFQSPHVFQELTVVAPSVFKALGSS